MQKMWIGQKEHRRPSGRKEGKKKCCQEEGWILKRAGNRMRDIVFEHTTF